MFERLAQIPIAVLQLLKEPRVLKSDHCLIGKRFEQRDLAIGEWLRNPPRDDDDADSPAVAP